MALSKELLAEFLYNRIFVETGTYLGDGVQQALNVGFDEIYSIEVSEEKFAACCDRFRGDKNVVLIYGDSREKLKELLIRLTEPATFWLDGYKGKKDSVGNCSLLEELKVICGHGIKIHTILIDDKRLFNRPGGSWGVKYVDIIKLLLEINPAYRISFRDGYVKDDIIVAEVSRDASQL